MTKTPITALVVQPDGDAAVTEITPDLTTLKELVGGWIEGVGAHHDDDWFAYANEEGRLLGLPVNKPATHLARSLGWPGDFLVGPVVFVGQTTDSEGDRVETDLPPRLLEWLSE